MLWKSKDTSVDQYAWGVTQLTRTSIKVREGRPKLKLAKEPERSIATVPRDGMPTSVTLPVPRTAPST